MYIWLCILAWCIYGALVVIYILYMDDSDIYEVKPLSAVMLSIVAGPTMWLVVGMAYLTYWIRQRRNR